jgi:uncharacterized membrane protein YphA (DoxX/SURF4 family)
MRIAQRLGTIAVWVLQVLGAVVFVLIGVAKFGDGSWARSFARWGYPDGFYMVIGALEVLGGLALLAPRVASYGAALLGAIMIGAAATHWLHGESGRVVAPLMYLAVLVFIGLARRANAVRPASRRTAARELGPM